MPEDLISSYRKSTDNSVFLSCTAKIPISLVNNYLPHRASEAGSTYDLPYELIHISNTIHDSLKILTLKNNWDEEGAVEIPKYVLGKAIDFLTKYSIRLFDVFDTTIPAPDINPLSDGSIDLEWKTENAILLVHFKNSRENVAFYYGKIRDKEFDINGKIPTNTVEDTFASWFKNLS